MSYCPLLGQITRFGIVGVSAAVVHFAVVVALVEPHWLQPLMANILGFGIAFQVSYWGHRGWTFSGTTQSHAVAVPRLLIVSGLTFMANESMLYILMNEFKLSYKLALFIVLSVLPLAVFTVNKWWVFE